MPSRPPLTASSWALAKDLYEQASGLQGAEQQAFLDAAQVQEPVRAEVRSLLAYDLEQGALGLQNPGFLSQTAALDLPEDAERTGERLGPWQILRPLGSGGMGDVFEAQRADGSYQGRAAIKLLKRGLDSVAILHRFAQERQALARMNHPNIATLLDAGLSADGLPFFVMEFIDGRAINEAALELGLEQRLSLFLQLTDAVAHAHRNLLVHRDLKPGNVLVTRQGQVKLLDFGIAKALDPLAGGESEQGPVTLLTQRAFTPQYASPEQVRGDAVSTATDIYSLGVLLYQMLTGLHPTGRSATTPAEIARSVLEEEPTRPSNLSPDLVADPQWLATRKRLKGDLDNILLMALEKTVQRRYASVDAMAQDIRSFLSGHPVSARPRTMGYVVGKFLTRHRFGAAAGALAIVALCSTTGVALWQARRADLERANAQQHLDDVRALARTMIFDVSDALANGVTPGRSALVKAATDYLTRRMDLPKLSMAETLEMANALLRVADLEGNTATDSLGQQDKALLRYSQGLSLLERIPQSERTDPKWWIQGANLQRSRSMVQQLRGEVQAALDSANAGSAMIERAKALGSTDPVVLRLTCKFKQEQTIALYSMDETPSLGRLDDAIQVARDALACTKGLSHGGSADTANTLTLSSSLAVLSRLMMMAGQLDEAVALARENLSVTSALKLRHPESQQVGRFHSIARSLLGYALMHAGQPQQGLAELAEGVNDAREMLRVDPDNDRARRDFVALAWTLGESFVTNKDADRGMSLCREAQTAGGFSQPKLKFDQEQKVIQDGIERCLVSALLLQRQSDRALRDSDTALRRLAVENPELTQANRRQVLQSRGALRLLRAQALQQTGRKIDAVEEAKVAVQDMDALLAMDASNSETQGDVARVRSQASLMGTAAKPQPGSVQCRWSEEAAKAFKDLADHRRMNVEYAVDQKRAQEQQARCSEHAVLKK